MTLRKLIKAIDPLKVEGDLNIDIKDLVFDSRKVSKGSAFFAIKGTQVDGHRFIEKAIQLGAGLIVCEHFPPELQTEVTIVEVNDSADALGLMSSAFYDYPSRQLKLIGITGTNGKTTTVSLLYDLFSGLGYKCGLLSTIENRIGKEVIPTELTTPDVVTINSLLADMVETGCDYAFMEVSSHSVVQKRIKGLHFALGIFSNMSHDHLDYHKTFAAYIKAKKGFFDQLPKSAFALINLDDKRGTVMVQNTKAEVKTYSLRKMADFKARIIENSFYGLQLEINAREVFTQFIGDFNAYNLLAVYGTAIIMEQEEDEVLQVLSGLKSAPGRFDYIRHNNGKTIGIVDYSHTPDALDKVLQTIQKIRNDNQLIITVVGAGGDRDKTKRPKMAMIAANNSDQVILTSDNPRTEAPEAIIQDMERGIPLEKQYKVLSITDRKQAIKTACRLARIGDIILVAGKGHENYQEINGVKHPFDDKEILKEEFQYTEN